MMQNIDEMITALKTNPAVLGLIEFGSQHELGDRTMGDYDLFVVLHSKPYAVSSLHFYVNDVPVDLNLITLDEMRRLTPGNGFRFVALLDARIIHDREGLVAEALARLRQREQESPVVELSASKLARTRHWHKHILDKVHGRSKTMPTFCQFLLNTNVHWLVESYFRVRRLPYQGEKSALTYWEQHEPELYQMLVDFYGTLDLNRKAELTHAITDRVLAPVGACGEMVNCLPSAMRTAKSCKRRHRRFLMRFSMAEKAPACQRNDRLSTGRGAPE